MALPWEQGWGSLSPPLVTSQPEVPTVSPKPAFRIQGGHLHALRTPRLLEQTPGMSLGKDRRGHPSCRYCRLSHPSGTSGSRTCTDSPPPTVATLHLPQLNQTAASERGRAGWEGRREGQCPYEQDFRKSLVLREREMGKTKRDPRQER